MRLSIRCIAVMAIFFISSCATNLNKLTVDKEVELSAESGYVLIGIDSNRDLYRMTLHGPTKVRLSSEDLAEGSNYILSPLEAGEYTIKRLYTSEYINYRFTDDANFKFRVEPGKISYVGHIEMISRGFWFPLTYMQLDNRSSQSFSFMEEKFPNILKSRQMVYGGPGEDRFLEFAQKIQGVK
ncbi:MAG: hypothetical protein OQJ89_05360 [Kangiellaceae bacterium]|nr:hypothetical protein [Kangiellaceae bacterium]MCW8999393.1 hypothetical protein [Kangiellaceae bacterium]MCW9016370.1 hypothetical protein [Kangiellaceae bacterium]